MSEFNRKIRHAGASTVPDVERVQAIRLYCESHRTTWNLQVRGPQWLGRGHGTEGKAFMVATARLGKDDLLALREAIDALLEE